MLILLDKTGKSGRYQHPDALTKRAIGAPDMADQFICKIDDCGKPAKAKGWCSAHYERWRKHGDPLRGGPLGTPDGEPQRYFVEVVLPYEGDDCLIWPYAKDSNGYGQMHLDGRVHYITRLACAEVHGPAPTDRHQAAHSCGNGHDSCCNPHHLRWATVQENHADKKEHGTFTPPPKVTKLSASQVHEIRSLKGKMTQREIAKIYGVGHAAIGAIHRGKTWSSLASMRDG